MSSSSAFPIALQCRSGRNIWDLISPFAAPAAAIKLLRLTVLILSFPERRHMDRDRRETLCCEPDRPTDQLRRLERLASTLCVDLFASRPILKNAVYSGQRHRVNVEDQSDTRLKTSPVVRPVVHARGRERPVGLGRTSVSLAYAPSWLSTVQARSVPGPSQRLCLARV